MAAVPGDGAERLHRYLAADGIVDHVRAMVAGQLLQRVTPVGLRIIDGRVGAVVAREFAFLLRGGGCDDARAEQLADLDRRNADAAGRAQYQQNLARLERTAF